ncbi:MAG: 3',5'-cyclic-nucleotide phosphodiesterase [Betaproteobacteria bacterium]|nr:3',5'-cyclic-nucleotide phosphodiesterase [Betaproteobacteria bacterium]
MKLTVLGCSGGIGGSRMRTTALLVDDDVLVDAGTGVADLDLDALARIDHLFVTHAHLDHIACLPLMIDSVGDRRSAPLVVHAIPEVLDALRSHIFNHAIWPDFSRIPSVSAPFLRYEPLEIGQPVSLGGRRFTALPVTHTVPAVGYRIDSGDGSLVFSGDTGPCSAFWAAVNDIANLRHLIVECAFPIAECELAYRSKHLCPDSLVLELCKLHRACDLYLTHLKPSQMEVTMTEIEERLGQFQPRMLRNGQVLEF